MKKGSIYFIITIILAIFLSGCQDKEQPVSSTEEDSENIENKSVKEEKKDSSTDNSNKTIELVESIDQFGNAPLVYEGENPDIYKANISEDSEGNVYITYRNRSAHLMSIIGDENGWNGTIDAFNVWNDERWYPRGQNYWVESEMDKDQFELIPLQPSSNGQLDSQNSIDIGSNAAFIANANGNEEVVLLVTEGGFDVVDTNGEVLAEFLDEKEVITDYNLDDWETSNMYVDLENQKVYFESDNGIAQLDMQTGKPLFEDGDIKTIQTDELIEIQDAGNGYLYVVERSNGDISVAMYDSNLDLVSNDFRVPVENPSKTYVTSTEDELHFWSIYEYELDTTLQLVKVNKINTKAVSEEQKTTKVKQSNNGIIKDLIGTWVSIYDEEIKISEKNGNLIIEADGIFLPAEIEVQKESSNGIEGVVVGDTGVNTLDPGMEVSLILQENGRLLATIDSEEIDFRKVEE